MRVHAPVLGVVVLGLFAGSAPAQVRDPAELLPAQTLAYVELRHPDRVAREIAGLLRGSALDDMPARLARYREQRGDGREMFFFDDMYIGMFSMFLTPEMVAEAARLHGGAVALTGFSKEREPEIVGVLLTGDSNGPGFFLRVYLTANPEIRKVAEVEGVNLYREKSRQFQFEKAVPGNPGQPPPPPPLVRETGPIYALLPGALVIGSSADGVKEVVRRFKGRTAEPALGSVAAIKEAVRLRDRPGLFAYADTAALAAQLDELIKDGAAREAPLYWNLLKTAVNLKAIRSVTASLALENGTADLRVQASLDPKQASPVLDLLSDRKVNPELLQFVPKGAMLAAAMSVSDGEKRWEKILALIDALARLHGASDLTLPSKMVAAAEEQLKLHIGKEVVGRITGLVFAMDPRDEVPAEGTRLGMLVLTAATAEDAQFLEETVPRLVGLLGRDEKAAPTRETIQGQRISSLPSAGLPWGTAVHYGRHGATLVIGQDRRTVAAALTGGAKKEGWLSEPRAAAAVKGLEEPVAIGLWSLGQSLAEVLLHPQVRAEKPVGVLGGPAAVQLVKPDETMAKHARDLLKATEPLPPVVLAVERKPAGATLTVRQAGLRGVTARVIDIWIDSTLDSFRRDRAGGPAGVGDKKAPLPPPPPPPIEKQ